MSTIRGLGFDEDDLDRQLSTFSGGELTRGSLARVLVAKPDLLLLDEPTRGLDYQAKTRLAGVLRELRRDGHTIVLATHDVELAAEVATRVVVLADGEVVADGPAAEIVVGSPMFAPQVAKVMAPLPWLTVAQAAAAMAAAS
jgi:energy-coupling factor transport system ATP-binding protein